MDHDEYNIYRYTWTSAVLPLIRSRKDLMRVFVHHHDCDAKISAIEGFMRWAKTPEQVSFKLERSKGGRETSS